MQVVCRARTARVGFATVARVPLVARA
eukprot:SAG31_NODE_14113_length_826_cov_4.792297_1_plen_26_part_10